MKQCPQCSREYDLSMSFCLDDGAELLYGPAEEPRTAILSAFGVPPSGGRAGDSPTLVFQEGEAEPSTDVAGSPERQGLSTHRVAQPQENVFAYRPAKLLVAIIVAGAILVAGLFGYQYFVSQSTRIDSIAVLPFHNRSADPSSEYLSDGLAESLIYRLSRIAGLKVSPTSSVIRYKGKDTDVSKIASELGVDAIMTGRLTQVGDNLTISIELIDVPNNKLIWGEQYERKMSDLLTTQREIAAEVTNKLQLKLSGEDARALTKIYTDNNEAYQLYLKGRFYGSKRTAKDARSAIENYQQAVVLDPKFALAYAGLAEANWFLALYSYPQVNDVVPRARELALKAMELDSSLAEPHSVLGIICANADRDLGCMEREQKRAIELNPNYWEAHRRLGAILMHLGRFDEAGVAFKRALEIDPLSPVTNLENARLLFYQEKYDESELMSKKNVELDPNFWYAHLQLHFVYRMKRDYPLAAEELARIQDARGEPDAAKFIRESFTGDWQEFLKRITAGRTRLKLYPYFVATFFAELGEKDEAFDMLNEAVETMDQHTSQMKVDPYMNPLRDDPRFEKVLRQVGFPE